jgi:chorismate mutase
MSSGTDNAGTSYNLSSPADRLRYIRDSLRFAEEDLIHIDENIVRLTAKRKRTLERIAGYKEQLSNPETI